MRFDLVTLRVRIFVDSSLMILSKWFKIGMVKFVDKCVECLLFETIQENDVKQYLVCHTSYYRFFT